MDLPAPLNVDSVTPSGRRSRVAQGLTLAAAAGRFELQECDACGTVQYPPREACCRCLSERLTWKVQSGAGDLLAKTVLHHSHDPYFVARLPWYVGLVRLDCGVSVVVHLSADVPKPPARVWVGAHLDSGGAGALIAFGQKDCAGSIEDRRLREICAGSRDADLAQQGQPSESSGGSPSGGTLR